MRFILMCIALLVELLCTAQTKRWDGEASDGSWGTSKNWYPDGVPSNADHVILDHSFIKTPYTISLPDGNLVTEAFDIIIFGNNDTISLLIPESNISSPALTLNNPGISINIENAGIVINRSGAPSGNTFQLAGNFRIANGGTYVHQTIRGTANIVSKLFFDNNTSLGIFKMDVPGTAGYILSLSGRNYGTLVLSADKSGGKKTYSGSGNNDLNIYGKLKIELGASLISSLNGNILLHDDYLNEGICQMNPTTPDSIGRSVSMTGINSTFTNHGTLQFNQHFSKWIIDKQASVLLNTPFEISMQNVTLNVYGKIICNDAYVYGSGLFKLNKNAKISTENEQVVFKDSQKGIIRTSQKELSTQSIFEFYGDKTQFTGDAFPDSLSYLKIDKRNGKIMLDKNLHIKDSMTLTNGGIMTGNNQMLSYSGKPIHQYDQDNKGYISGGMRQISTIYDSLYFPLGNDSLMMQVMVIADHWDGRSFEISADTLNDIAPINPKFNKQGNLHWHLIRTNETDQSILEKIYLQCSTDKFNNFEKPLILQKSSTDEWKYIESLPIKPNDKYLTSISSNISSAIYTIGSVIAAPLALNKLSLDFHKTSTQINLYCSYNFTQPTDRFFIERSSDGIYFKTVSIVYNQNNSLSGFFTTKRMIENQNAWFRVRAQSDGADFISNAIYLSSDPSLKIFPNPASEWIFINFPFNKAEMYIIGIDGQKHNVNYENNGSFVQVNIAKLSKGLYTLLIIDGTKMYQWKFIK